MYGSKERLETLYKMGYRLFVDWLAIGNETHLLLKWEKALSLGYPKEGIKKSSENSFNRFPVCFRSYE